MKKFILAVSLLMASSAAFSYSYTCPAGRLALVQANVGRMVIKCNWQAGMPAFTKDVPWASASYKQANIDFIFKLAIEAKLNKRAVRIYIQDDSSGNPNGCEGHNCRKLIALRML